MKVICNNKKLHIHTYIVRGKSDAHAADVFYLPSAIFFLNYLSTNDVYTTCVNIILVLTNNDEQFLKTNDKQFLKTLHLVLNDRCSHE